MRWLALCAALLSTTAGAQEQPSIGRGVACDTKEQAIRYVEVLEGQVERALAKVNAEVGNDEACVSWTVAFLPIEEVAQVSNQHGAYRIVRIVVFGAQSPLGMMPRPPAAFFAVARLPGHEI